MKGAHRVDDVLVLEDVEVVLVLVLVERLALDARVRLGEHRDEHVDEDDVRDEDVDPHERQAEGDRGDLVEVELGKHRPERLVDEGEGGVLDRRVRVEVAAQHVRRCPLARAARRAATATATASACSPLLLRLRSPASDRCAPAAAATAASPADGSRSACGAVSERPTRARQKPTRTTGRSSTTKRPRSTIIWTSVIVRTPKCRLIHSEKSFLAHHQDGVEGDEQLVAGVDVARSAEGREGEPGGKEGADAQDDRYAQDEVRGVDEGLERMFVERPNFRISFARRVCSKLSVTDQTMSAASERESGSRRAPSPRAGSPCRGSSGQRRTARGRGRATGAAGGT